MSEKLDVFLVYPPEMDKVVRAHIRELEAEIERLGEQVDTYLRQIQSKDDAIDRLAVCGTCGHMNDPEVVCTLMDGVGAVRWPSDGCTFTPPRWKPYWESE